MGTGLGPRLSGNIEYMSTLGASLAPLKYTAPWSHGHGSQQRWLSSLIVSGMGQVMSDPVSDDTLEGDKSGQ